jgi:hypothetical protein
VAPADGSVIEYGDPILRTSLSNLPEARRNKSRGIRVWYSDGIQTELLEVKLVETNC